MFLNLCFWNHVSKIMFLNSCILSHVFELMFFEIMFLKSCFWSLKKYTLKMIPKYYQWAKLGISRHLANVQKSIGIILDDRRGWPRPRYGRLDQTKKRWTIFYKTCSRIFRRFRRHRQWKSSRAIYGRSSTTRSESILRVSGMNFFPFSTLIFSIIEFKIMIFGRFLGHHKTSVTHHS